MKFIDLTGNRYGELVALEYRPEKPRTKWLCRCDCGRETVVDAASLKRLTRPTQSCGCHKLIKGKDNLKWKGCGEISGQRWATIRHGASKRNIEFNITIEFAWNLFLKQCRKCALSDLPLEFKKVFYSASLDRIDSLKPYTEDNVQWIHVDINKMKNAFPEEYFKSMCRLIVEKEKM